MPKPSPISLVPSAIRPPPISLPRPLLLPEAAIAASGGGLSRLMGGGLMALGTRLMGLGLGMGDIQNIARELFRFGRDKIGADQMGEIIAGTPGLKQFA